MEQTQLTQEEKLDAILQSTLKTERYMRWQLYITVALVVIPVIATLAILPMVFKAVTQIGSIYNIQ